MPSDLENTLIVMVGLPRSGKTTWAQKQGMPIVCPDQIRLAIHGQRFIPQAEPYVWLTAKTMAKALFGAGHQFVILDACNTTRMRRDEWLSERWVTRFRHIDTDEQVCMDRAEATGDVEICPIIASAAKKFEPLADTEQPWPDAPVWSKSPLELLLELQQQLTKLGHQHWSDVVVMEDLHRWLGGIALQATSVPEMAVIREYVVKLATRLKGEDVPAAAFDILKTSLQMDTNFAWSWHCNIAMAFYDAAHESIPTTLRSITGNEAAARFMKLCFDIDTSKSPEWETLGIGK